MKERILEFFKRYNIAVKRSGVGVAQHHININCPYCDKDEKFTMGIDLKTGKFGCWWGKDRGHAGVNFYKLVAKLLDVSLKEAKSILGMRVMLEGEADFKNSINKMFEPRVLEVEGEISKVKKIQVPEEFKTIRKDGTTGRFWTYLEARGIDPLILTSRYTIYCALQGRYAQRIIIPYYYQGQLMSWTARTIRDGRYEDIRYKDLSVGESIIHVKHLIYNYDELIRDSGDGLFFCEGVFDCFNLEQHLPLGYRATCISTKSMQTAQIGMIKKLSKRYKTLYLLLDEDAMMETVGIGSELRCFVNNLQVLMLPSDIKDPGSMSEQQVQNLVRGIEEKACKAD